MLATFAFQAHSGIAAAQLVTFEFTRPPLEPREDVDTAPWSRIVIMELHRPTFDGAVLHVNDQLQAEAWTALYKSAQIQDDIGKIEVVNGFVNHLGLAVNASQNPELPEWTAPREFFEGAKILDGAHAIAKYFALLALGIPENRLCLVVVDDMEANREQILLVVLTSDTFYILDDKHDELLPEKALGIYNTLYFINADSAWRPVFKEPIYDREDDDDDDLESTASYGPAYPTGQDLKLFIPSTSKKGELSQAGRYKYWDRVLQAEDDDPTFSGRSLNLDNAALRKDWAKLYDGAANGDIHAKIKQVEAFFNKIQYRSDRENWGTEDYWALPREFLAKGTGDCEDYAIAKYFALKALKVSPKNMMIVSVRDVKNGGYHAILVVLYGSSFYVLDNASNRIYRNSSVSTYKPRYYLSENYNWIHPSGK